MNSYSKSVSIWLLIGCIMILIQIAVGGITRLTDSGLSITEWNVIKGTLPPMNETEWTLTFEKYKTHAKKQYETLHASMDLAQFKKIYFWEYFHRLWARGMGFVFIIPFMIFSIGRLMTIWKKHTGSISNYFREVLTAMFYHKLLKRLFIVILLASLSAIFGWIMVASGLNNDKRTWVNAYNLMIHLILASSLFAYLVYTYFHYSFQNGYAKIYTKKLFLWKLLGGFLVLQIGLGALMAGMKAGLIFPYPFILFKWSLFSDLISQSSLLGGINFYDYEPNAGIKIWVQLFHRLNAWNIAFLSGYFIVNNLGNLNKKNGLILYTTILVTQVVMGIVTVSFCVGKIPVTLGVMHQVIAFLLLASYLWVLFTSKADANSRV